MTTRPLLRVGVATTVAVTAILALTGCAPSLTDRVKSSAADAVEHAQDDLWEYRDGFVSDPEETLAQLAYITDTRNGLPDPDQYGQYTLMGMDTGADGTSLTLLASGGASNGGGWWYEQRTAAVCFTLTFPASEDSILTAPAECVDIPQLDLYDEILPLDALDVRREVTSADYPAPICQCYSGSECDCPGG